MSGPARSDPPVAQATGGARRFWELLVDLIRRIWCRIFGCGPTVVVAVRHADVDPGAGQDPPLNAEGQDRADALVHLLGLSGASAVYSSPLERTRATARPLAAHLGTAVLVRPATPTSELAQEILRDHRGRTVVVVGHSNTVPQLAVDLGATYPTTPFAATDFDNVLWVTVPRRGRSSVYHLRYGVAT